MTAAVTDIRHQRARKVPAWNPDTRRHAWEDIAGAHCPTCGDTPEEEHRCLHCRIVVHSAQEDGRWVQHFTVPRPDGPVRRGRMPSRGKCPGPQPPHLEVVPAPVEEPAPSGVVRPCSHCVPPIQPCGRPTRFYLSGWHCDRPGLGPDLDGAA